MKLRVFAVVALVALMASSCWGAIIDVPDYGSIQAAINAASPGDTIQLQQGTYSATTTVRVNKAVVVDGGGSTISFSANTYAFIITGGGATLQNFNIVKTDTGDQWLLQILASNVSILNNTLQGKTTGTYIIKNRYTRGFEFGYNCKDMCL